MQEVAEIKWEKDYNLTYVKNILDTKPGQLTCVIGTLFKEQPLKPSILKNLLGTLGTRKFKNGTYISEEDYAVLEDSSGRVRIKKGENFSPESFVTGSILALKGVVDSKGFFEVKDHCFAGIPFKALPKQVNVFAPPRPLFGKIDGNREFVCLVSGLEFGEAGDVMSSEMLLRFVRGELGSSEAAVKVAS